MNITNFMQTLGKGMYFRVCTCLCLNLITSTHLHADTSMTLDPTKPPVEVLAITMGEDATQHSNVVLNGIKQDGQASFAILNDTFVRVGEVYKGYRLVAVRQSHVILEDEAKEKTTLSMNVVDFKKSTTGAPPTGKSRKRQSSASSLQHH